MWVMAKTSHRNGGLWQKRLSTPTFWIISFHTHLGPTQMHSKQFLSFLVSMLAITNPLGSLAVFLGMSAQKTEEERKQTALVTTLTIFIVLFLIVWLGIPLLTFFGISLPAFQITGGLIILLRALTMLHSEDTPTSRTAKEVVQDASKESIGVVPLAIPIIAGPGAMTNTIIFSRQFPQFINKVYISLGVLLIALIMGTILYFATPISKMIGETGIKTVTRIMGLILAAIAVSMITAGLQDIFPGAGGLGPVYNATMAGITH